MKLTLQLFNILASAAGSKQQVLEVADGSSTRVVLHQLARQHPQLTPYLLANGHISEHLRIFRNGQLVLALDRALSDGDQLLLFPAISGGSATCLPSARHLP
ncbi:MAG: MoaD/ThiS family protein [Deinococcus sp.]|nr:MoaD/ThiS family protein [Deinococcus sp.]